jgi:hypothetical protein
MPVGDKQKYLGRAQNVAPSNSTAEVTPTTDSQNHLSGEPRAAAADFG